MSKTASNLLFLAIGAAIGAAVGYVAATDKDKKEEWLNDVSGLVNRVKGNVKNVAAKGKEKLEEITSNVNAAE